MCGLLAGIVVYWNQLLDNAFTLKVLLANGMLQLVHIHDNPATFMSYVNGLNIDL